MGKIKNERKFHIVAFVFIFAGLFLFSKPTPVGAAVTQSGIAQGSGFGASITITHGLPIDENDVIIAFVHVNRNQRVTDNNGTGLFTEVIDENAAGSNGHAIYSRMAGPSEPATYQWTMPIGDRWSVEIRVFKNVDTSNIWTVAPSPTTRSGGSGATATAPSVTIDTVGAMGIFFVMSDTPVQNFDNPTNGYSDELEAGGQPQATYIRTWPTTGATGQTSATMNSNDWMAYQMALRPPDVIGPDTTPPFRSNGQPVGTAAAGTASTNISLTTNEAAICRYSTVPDTAYPSMVDTFTSTGDTAHSTLVDGLTDGNTYDYYIKCADTNSNENTDDFSITFDIALPNTFQNEVVTSGLNFPISIQFLPDGRMLIAELPGIIRVLQPGAPLVDPTPFLEITNIGSFGEQGLLDILLDPDYATNGYFYVYYTAGDPNRNRISRFTSDGTSAIPGSEFVIWQDNVDASGGHHGGQIDFGPDGKIYLSIGDNRVPSNAQSLTSFRGKVLRINADGTVPTDNPYYDGIGPNLDAIWALGLRNPFRASFDDETGQYYIADVGMNDFEELNRGIAGANYGWPNCEGPCDVQGMTNPIYSHPHPGSDTSITGGFVYRGSQFPSEYYGSYFFGDYAQNLINRLTLNPDGTTVTGFFNFEPPDGMPDGPFGDIVYLIEGPDGALYYVDLGFSDHPQPGEPIFSLSKIRKIRYEQGNHAPVAVVSATPLAGTAPLTVNFSSDGSFDPENENLSYLWTFGDGETSTEANPVHVYQQNGLYSANLSLSDGNRDTLSDPINIAAGIPPIPTIIPPPGDDTFRAGDVIVFSGEANDAEDGVLDAGAFTWDVHFHHDTHIHPTLHLTNSLSVTLEVPTTGHDFSDETSYEIILTVTDSDNLSTSTSVFIYPQKVDLSFDTLPSGLTLNLDGISRTTPFVLDTLIGFNHVIEAVNQSQGGHTYNFVDWSDGGAQQHNIIVPDIDTSYVAAYEIVQNSEVTQSGRAVANGFGASISIAHGLPIDENDVIIAFVHVNRNQRITDDNGTSLFTEVIDEDAADSNGHAIYSRIAGPSEPPTYQWTMPIGDRWSVEIRVFKNVDTSNIWDVAPSPTTRSSGIGATPTAPSVTINTVGAMGIFLVMSDTPSQDFGNPTNGYGDELEAAGQPQATYIGTWLSTGVTGQTSATMNSNDWMAYQIALRPLAP